MRFGLYRHLTTVALGLCLTHPAACPSQNLPQHLTEWPWPQGKGSAAALIKKTVAIAIPEEWTFCASHADCERVSVSCDQKCSCMDTALNKSFTNQLQSRKTVFCDKLRVTSDWGKIYYRDPETQKLILHQCMESGMCDYEDRPLCIHGRCSLNPAKPGKSQTQ